MRLLPSLAILFAVALATNAAAAPDNANWRDVSPENLLLIDVKYGRIAIELYPAFAPEHVKRMRALARAHFYDGLTFYRVIDGFVAQGGIGEGDDKKIPEWPALKREFERGATDDVNFTPLGSPDAFAAEVGHVNGFAAGRDVNEGKTWLVHCYGTVAMARDDNPDTGGTEFYIVIGQTPRRLDRNLSVFGRVIDGMEYVQKLNRGDPEVESGVIQDASKRDPILKVQIAADMPASKRPRYQVMRTEGSAFEERKETRRKAASPFWLHQPSPILEICGVTVPVRRVGPERPTPPRLNNR